MTDIPSAITSRSSALATIEARDAGDGHMTADQLVLRAQGHIEEMPRQFSLFAAVGLAFSITNSWIAISAIFQQPLLAGGGPGVVYPLLVACCSCFVITVGLAELASAFPTSGGQYHFAFMLSSPSTRSVAAFVTGWLSVIAWILCTAASAIYAAQMIVYLAAAYHDDYTPTPWQIWIVYVLIMLFCAAILIFAPTLLARLEESLFLLSVVGFVVFLTTILASAKPKNSAKLVFVDFNNQSGWDNGLSFMLACGTAMYTFIGTDSAIHVAEEIPNSQRNVPRTMCLTMVIGILTSVPWAIAFLFAGGDLEELQTSSQAIRTMFASATQNEAAATVFTVWFLLIYLGATLGCLAATGRQAWAFARDGGLPFSTWNATIHCKYRMPANATIACVGVIILYGLIYIGSTEAFNSFINASILVMNVTYAIPQAIVLVRGRKTVLPERAFDLGKFGVFCNAATVAWISLFVVLFCFPVSKTTSVKSMNYVSVVVIGITVIIMGLWYGGKRKTFTGPNNTLDLDFASDANVLDALAPIPSFDAGNQNITDAKKDTGMGHVNTISS